MKPSELGDLIKETIIFQVNNNEFVTRYREPIIGFIAADDPGFAHLSEWTNFDHMVPDDLLPGARTVVCFFLPFAPEIAAANTQQKEQVAREWAVAYQDTNTLIEQIISRLKEVLSQYGFSAAAEPATGNFNENELRSHWSHKSIAVMAGIGSFGLHQLVITDAGCAGRIGSFVIDAELPMDQPERKERCEFFKSGTCIDCVYVCPVNALFEDQPIDRRLCWMQCVKNGIDFLDIGVEIKVCGKCAVIGPCALEAAV